eukprot:5438-Heterococcus_DN1.PRE.2
MSQPSPFSTSSGSVTGGGPVCYSTHVSESSSPCIAKYKQVLLRPDGKGGRAPSNGRPALANSWAAVGPSVACCCSVAAAAYGQCQR